MTEIKPHIFVWVPEKILDLDGDPEFNLAGTAGFIITSEGVIVVNTTNSPFHARELLFEIRRRTDQPVKYVINTDSRGDHILGNEVFADQQAAIISTSPALAEMRQYQQDLTGRMNAEEDLRLQTRMRGFHVTFPTRTFDNQMALRLGGQEIKLMKLNKDSPAGEAAVDLPGARVVFLGDLFENGYIPRPASKQVTQWIETLRQVENWDVDVYVPGHGPPGGKEELVEFRKFLEWMGEKGQSPLDEKSFSRAHPN